MRGVPGILTRGGISEVWVHSFFEFIVSEPNRIQCELE